jgi:pimeloyl-ACP methyl ester carboxylesterase
MIGNEIDGIYYESAGSPDNPLLLLIPGGSGDAGPYGPLLRLLSDRFRVVAYDRRGFSRSTLAGPVEQRFEQDVQDAADLIDALSADGRAYVFGSSSGAILGLHLLIRHPDRVRRLVAHEPPLVGLLPDADEWFAFFEKVARTGRSDGVRVAMQQFNAVIGMRNQAPPVGVQLPDEVVEMMRRMDANLEFFLEQEVTDYTRREPDRAALAAQRDKLVLAGGRESREFVPYRPNLILAEWLGLRVHDYPGDHIGYVTEAAGFATALRTDLS